MIASVFGFIIRIGVFGATINNVLLLVVVVNTMLFLFNLLPIPPLDGSKIVSSLLPHTMARGYARWRMSIEQNPFFGMGLVLLVVILLGDMFGGAVYSLASVIAGV